ncbi:MAG: hypothetical protein KC621_28755 [Myxococcales bacterium]|nr:hypothetical protein [Myxococcales bacterium]
MPEMDSRLRAVVLAIVIAVHGLAAAPIPHVVTQNDLRNPVSAEEVRRWAERLTALGLERTPEQLGEEVIWWTERIGGAHHAALAPFRSFFRFTGTNQGWALFANPDTHPIRLQIRVRREGRGDWEILFQRLDPEHDWAADLLAYRRVRGVYDAGGYRSRPRGNYRRFAKWIAHRVLDGDPTVQAVEIRSLRTHTTTPAQQPDPRIEVRHVIEIGREP